PSVQREFAVNRFQRIWSKRMKRQVSEFRIEYLGLTEDAGYRTRCGIRPMDDNGRVVLGMASWFPSQPPIELKTCRNHSPELNGLLESLAQVLNPLLSRDDWRRIREIRCQVSASGTPHLTFVTITSPDRSRHSIERMLENVRSIPAEVWLLETATPGTSTRFKTPKSLGEPAPLTCRVGHRLIHLAPNIWSPVAPDSEQILIGKIRDWIPDSSTRVVEIGCGAGTISHMLADWGFQVTGIDVDRTAVATARLNLIPENESRAEFRVGEGTHAVRRLLQKGFHADTAIVHGMRGAFGRSLFDALSAAGVRRIILVSPSTHAWCHDASSLVFRGWSLDTISIIDQLPNTAGFLTAACLRKNPLSR
ncbi:MAG TPA: methyltransferase domain-containing protein, partial [bacterium]|nr:methyltransferase domain-containing protein [bacterium]